MIHRTVLYALIRLYRYIDARTFIVTQCGRTTGRPECTVLSVSESIHFARVENYQGIIQEQFRDALAAVVAGPRVCLPRPVLRELTADKECKMNAKVNSARRRLAPWVSWMLATVLLAAAVATTGAPAYAQEAEDDDQ